MKKAILTNIGVICDEAALDVLTHTYLSKKGTRPLELRTYSTDEIEFRGNMKKYLRIPRAYAFDNYAVTLDMASFTMGERSDNMRRKNRRCCCNIQLDKNQQVMYDKIMVEYMNKQNICEGKCSFILQMPTGSGKTYLSGKLISTYGFKTMVVAPKTVIEDSWIPMLEKNFPYSNYSTDRMANPDILLCSIRMASSHVEELLDYKMIILDEVHKMATPSYSKIFWHTAPIVIGLTATPDERIDGFDIVYKQHLGNVIYSDDVDGFVNEITNFKGKVKRIRYQSPSYNVDSYSRLLCSICENKDRLKLLCHEIKKMFNNGCNFYVLADRVDYLFTLKDKTYPNRDDVYVISGTKNNSKGLTNEELLYQAKDNARIIFGTYQIFTEGVSINRMDGLVLATPRRNKIRQMLGRILRRDGNKERVREIIDICDERTMCHTQFLTRQVVYSENNYDIEDVIVNYGAYLVKK